MRKLRSIALLLIFATVLAAPAQAFRCGNRIVTEGDDIAHVAHVCGEPDSVQHWTEVRLRPIYYHERVTPHFERRHRSHFALPVEIHLEQWTYNLGARRFMRVLRFENGRLVDIRATRYGYSD